MSALARTALALSGALAVVGTLVAAPAEAAPTSKAAPTVTAVMAKAPAPCVTKGCRVVTRVDVDGDGRTDAVSMTPTRAGGAPAWTLRVVTARKAVSQVTYATPYLTPQTSWYGAARIDGVAGNELVVRTGFGAHAQFFAVYSWRGGKLTAQREPGAGTAQWYTDGAWSIMKGFTSGTRNGRKTLTSRVYERDTVRRAYFNGSAVTYTWRGGAWRKTASSTVYVHETSPKVAAAYGWRVAGLPR